MATEPGLGTSERSLMRLCGPRVVPAKAGTHTPQLKEGALRQTPSATINIGGWVPAFAGTTSEGGYVCPSSRCGLGELFVKLVVIRREGRERLGRERDRLAVSVGQRRRRAHPRFGRQRVKGGA